MRKRAIIAIAGLVLLLGACTQRGYNAKPVVSADDPRSTETPDLGDEDAREKQDCFMIEIYPNGVFTDFRDEGIACMVEPER